MDNHFDTSSCPDIAVPTTDTSLLRPLACQAGLARACHACWSQIWSRGRLHALIQTFAVPQPFRLGKQEKGNSFIIQLWTPRCSPPPPPPPPCHQQGCASTVHVVLLLGLRGRCLVPACFSACSVYFSIQYVKHGRLAAVIRPRECVYNGRPSVTLCVALGCDQAFRAKQGIIMRSSILSDHDLTQGFTAANMSSHQLASCPCPEDSLHLNG